MWRRTVTRTTTPSARFGATTSRRWRHDFRPPMAPRPQREKTARYRLRQRTVEPVLGIVKQTMDFRQFLLRGIDKVQGEWGRVMLAYNCRRLHNLTRA